MTIYGWDASHYDAVPSGARVVSEGFSFMTHKAGGDANDAELSAWWSALKPYRDQVLLGAYWVLYPGNPSGRADAFLARLDSQCPGWRDGPFILQLDCEIWNGDLDTQPDLMEIKTACNRLNYKMPKLTPVVYASAGQYGSSLRGLGFPLWNARYPSNAVGTASGIYVSVGGDSGPGWGSYSGQGPAIWQFTSSAIIAGQSTSDANAYRGTLQELTALVAPGWSTPMTTLDADDIAAVAKAVWATKIQDPYDTNSPARQLPASTWLAYGDSRNLVDTRLPQAAGIAKDFNDFAADWDAFRSSPPAAQLDVQALATALAPLIDGVDEAEMTRLIEQAVRNLVNGTPAS
jgi:hypothetical protein